MIGFLRHLRAFLSAPSRKKFFSQAFSRGVADAVAHEYYSHCRRRGLAYLASPSAGARPCPRLQEFHPSPTQTKEV
jgi:hypothetical protein